MPPILLRFVPRRGNILLAEWIVEIQWATGGLLTPIGKIVEREWRENQFNSCLQSLSTNSEFIKESHFSKDTIALTRNKFGPQSKNLGYKKSFRRIAENIIKNPKKWSEDKFYY